MSELEQYKNKNGDLTVKGSLFQAKTDLQEVRKDLLLCRGIGDIATIFKERFTEAKKLLSEIEEEVELSLRIIEWQQNLESEHFVHIVTSLGGNSVSARAKLLQDEVLKHCENMKGNASKIVCFFKDLAAHSDMVSVKLQAEALALIIERQLKYLDTVRNDKEFAQEAVVEIEFC